MATRIVRIGLNTVSQTPDTGRTDPAIVLETPDATGDGEPEDFDAVTEKAIRELETLRTGREAMLALLNLLRSMQQQNTTAQEAMSKLLNHAANKPDAVIRDLIHRLIKYV